MSIKKNFFHNILLILSNILFPIISFSYVSHVLGPDGLGKVQFVINFAQYFVIVAALGIPYYGVREVAKVRDNKQKLSKLLSELLIINLIGSIILLFVYIIIIFEVGWFQKDLNFFIISGSLILSGFSTLEWFYMGIEKFQFLSIRSICIKFIAIITLLLFVKTPSDLLFYFLITIFSVIGNNIWNLVHLSGIIQFNFRKLDLKKHIPALITIFSTSIAISIYTLVDTLFLGFLADEKSVGLYAAAIKINKLAIPIATSLGTVLIPRITQSLTLKDQFQLKELTDQSFSFICLLAIPISTGLFIYAPEILTVFSGSKFLSAIPTMQIAAPLVFLIGLGHIFGFQLLIPGGFERKYLIATVLGMMTSIVLNILLIGTLKDKGAAISIVMGEIVVTITSFYFVIKKMKLRFNWKLVLNALLACLFFFPIAWFVRNFGSNEFINLAIAVAACSTVYIITQFYIFKERNVKEALLKLHFIK